VKCVKIIEEKTIGKADVGQWDCWRVSGGCLRKFEKSELGEVASRKGK